MSHQKFQSCIDACEACAVECGKHANDHCEKCAEACEKCAEAWVR